MSTTNSAARAAKQHAKSGSASRISGNSLFFQYALIVGVLSLYLCASLVSFQGLYAIAPWLHLASWASFAIPVFIDLAVVIYKLSEVVLKARGQYKAARKAVIGTFFFTGVSALANGLHVYSQSGQSASVELIGGVFIAVIAPWAVYWAASVLTDVLVKPKPVATKARATAARKAPARARAGVRKSPEVHDAAIAPLESALV